jgi:hypothetical protein
MRVMVNPVITTNNESQTVQRSRSQHGLDVDAAVAVSCRIRELKPSSALVEFCMQP